MNMEAQVRIIITGATGFIGRALAKELVGAGYEVVVLSRNPKTAKGLFEDKISAVRWDGNSSEGWKDYVNGAFAIINLAGENIAAGRWTKKRKQAILESRLNAGKAIVEAVKQAQQKPKVVIQSSGIGYYGSGSEEMLDESSPPGEGFLPQVAKQWESSTKEVESLGVRHVVIRTGIVLGMDGGALPRLVRPFRFFVGGHLGSGKQWFSWIHISDEVRAIRFLVGKEELRGAFNLTSPGALQQKQFCKILGKAMSRPSWLPVPGLLMRLFMGEMAEELLLSGQRVIPKRLLEAGYEFQYLEAESALHEILG
jgi:uncharacterized protein (TIGR01777 family)